MQYKDLIDSYGKFLFKKKHLEFQKEFWWNIFSSKGGFDNYKKYSEAEAMAKFVEAELDRLRVMYAEHYEKKISSNSKYYAITIGSAEKDDIGPCYDLWNRFIDSADGKDFVTAKGFFEKGDNGYIHIHALIEKTKGWSMSMPKIRSRYGKYKGKQHNFDIKRISGIEITKWQNYIKKDSTKQWNLTVNDKLKCI